MAALVPLACLVCLAGPPEAVLAGAREGARPPPPLTLAQYQKGRREAEQRREEEERRAKEKRRERREEREESERERARQWLEERRRKTERELEAIREQRRIEREKRRRALEEGYETEMERRARARRLRSLGAARRALLKRFPPVWVTGIMEGRVETGWSAEAVRESWGPPERIATGPGRVEVWHYARGRVLFEDGIVTSVTTPAPPPR